MAMGAKAIFKKYSFIDNQSSRFLVEVAFKLLVSIPEIFHTGFFNKSVNTITFTKNATWAVHLV